MAIGPVQLIVLGFVQPDFKGEVIAELERLRQSDTIRVIDALAVYKHDDGEIETQRLSNLTDAEEVLVERVKWQRNAEAEGRYADVFGVLSGRYLN